MGTGYRIIYNCELIISKKTAPLLSRPIIIIGKRSMLPQAFATTCEERNLNYHFLAHDELDFTKPEQVDHILHQLKPWAIINTTDYAKIEQAEIFQDNCFSLNTRLPQNLAHFTDKHGIKLLTFSTDQVFDGQKNTGYTEHDKTNPLNIYGQSKKMGEDYVLANDPSALIVRTGMLFGPSDYKSYATDILRQLEQQIPVKAENDVFVTPTYVPDLVQVCLDLLIDDEKGIWHLANNSIISWADFAKDIAHRAGENVNLIHPVSLRNMEYKASRPKFSALNSIKGKLLPSLDSALDHFFKEMKVTA